MSTLHDIGEFGFIERIVRIAGGEKAAGDSEAPLVPLGADDCAVLRMGGATLLLTSDMAVEDVHFRRDAAGPEDVGWKAAAAALSDIAAMGGAPRYVLSSVAAPANTSTEGLEGIFRGIVSATEEAGARLVGGDTVRSLEGITLDLTVVGEAIDGRYLTRAGARDGDMLVVTGWPGRAGAGLLAQENGLYAPDLIRAHYRPQPRIREGQWLCAREEIHAMIDVSDGALQDAAHLSKRSGLGVSITSASVAVDPELATICMETGRSMQELVLQGGEAYELLFAIDPTSVGPTLDAFRDTFGLPAIVLGTFSSEFEGVMLDGAPPEEWGFEQFS